MMVRKAPPTVHCLGLAGAALIVLAAAALLPPDAPLLAAFECPFRAATGLPCLGCGFTHAFQFAVRGRFIDALCASPLGTALALCAMAHVAWTALRIGGLAWGPALEPGPRVRFVCALALAANWGFVALQGRP